MEEVPVDEVQAADVVLVRAGEVVPVDGKLVSEEAVLDTSTLSGEPLPETVTAGTDVRSGSANAGAPFDLRASNPWSTVPSVSVPRVCDLRSKQWT